MFLVDWLQANFEIADHLLGVKWVNILGSTLANDFVEFEIRQVPGLFLKTNQIMAWENRMAELLCLELNLVH